MSESPRFPQVAFGESPYNKTDLLRDNEFEEGDTWWNYTSSPNIKAEPSTDLQKGMINHSSEEVPGAIPIISADYEGMDVTPLLQEREGEILLVDSEWTWKLIGGWTQTRRILNVFFSSPINDGDVILLHFTGGFPCVINVRNENSQSGVTYGVGQYIGGNIADIIIPIGGLPSPRNSFNLDISFETKDRNGADLDHVIVPSPLPHSFDERANLNQTFTAPSLTNISYTINFTTNVAAFETIQYANLSLRIGTQRFWSKTYLGIGSASEIVEIPVELLQAGGEFTVVFDLHLIVDTSSAANFLLYIDSAYLFQTPVLNLLQDSACKTGIPWIPNSYDNQYGAQFVPPTGGVPSGGYFLFSTRAMSGDIGEFSDGRVDLRQNFTKNCSLGASGSIEDLQLKINYLPLNLTGIDHVNMTIQLNETMLLENFTIDSTSTSWKQVRTNHSAIIDANYTLNITMDVKIETTFDDVNWTFFLDNIYLYPLWNSTLTQLGEYDGNVTSGSRKNVFYHYNMTDLDPTVWITDAIVIVYNNDTGNEWGLDFGATKKYIVTNFENGTYYLRILTVGISSGEYNLSVNFLRPNFPDAINEIPLNITGTPTNLTVVEGGHYNLTNNMWFVDADNAPYVDDTTRQITVNFTGEEEHEPIENAYIEAYLGPNLCNFLEVYKQTFQEEDKGLYTITLDTTGLSTALDYLEFNFSIIVSAPDYSPSEIECSTLINLLPSGIILQEIDPVYQGTSIDFVAVFQDTFHETAINDATLSWQLMGTGQGGTLNFIFMGYYQQQVSTSVLVPGTYTLNITGMKTNFETSTSTQEIEILAKYNVSVSVNFPDQLIEGNTYTVEYNFTYSELETPMVGKLVHFTIQYITTEKMQTFNDFSDEGGTVGLPISIPLGETSIQITAAYDGMYNVSTLTKDVTKEVLPKFGVILELLSTEFAAELVGERTIEIRAKLTDTAGNPLTGYALVFRIGTSEGNTLTDSDGIARVGIRLPTEGTFEINVTFAGTGTMAASTIAPVSLNIISPTTLATRNLIRYAIIAAIVAAVGIASYIAVNRGIVIPRHRRRQAELVTEMNRFEDARNIQLLMVINREAGVEIYSKSLGGVPVDPTLVSGFLQAITQFGQEIVVDKSKPGKGPKKEGLQELAFHHFKIVMSESMHFRVALLLLKSPSNRVLDSLKQFTDSIEQRFGTDRALLSGKQLDDSKIWDLVETNFEPSLIYIHMIDFTKINREDLGKWEGVVLEEIEGIPFNGEAYLDKVQDEAAQHHVGKELEILKAALSLRQQKALIPLTPEYMEYRIGIAQAINSLPVEFKKVILALGEGERDLIGLQARAEVKEEEFKLIMTQIQELGMVDESLELQMPGKVAYTHIRCTSDIHC